MQHNEHIATEEHIMPAAATKWYVGDMHDNFAEFDTAQEAGQCADEMVADLYEGVYVLRLTEAQFEQFCITGRHTVGKM
jgi:hypothetical protein